MKKYIILIITLISFVGCGYTSSTQAGAVGVKRKQFMTLSASSMQKGAVQAYSQILAKAKKEGKLNQDKKSLKRIRTVASRLIPQVKYFRTDALKWKWEVNLITSDQLNAWCMPGGKIAFYTAIIDKLKLTDAEIAAIMGHEISHALREHGRERASQQSITSAGLAIVGAYFKLGQSGMNLAQQVTSVTLTLPNSRKHETEADRMGVELAARAGYDPYAAVRVWEKMSKISKGAPPEILSTHPSNKTRIKDLTKYAKIVYPLYKKSKH
jgi:predicted Zn-dependent protease